MTTEDTPPEDKQPAAPKKRRGRPPGAPDRRKRKDRKSTVKNSTTSPRKIVKTKKFLADVETALEYRIMGYTFAQISKEMGFKPGIGHAYYQTPCKPLPQWLFHLMFFAIIPPMIVAMMVWTQTAKTIG
jgi:hypothetical protein